MTKMQITIKAIEDEGLRGKSGSSSGGAPLTETYASTIGAAGYAPDASRAVTLPSSLPIV